MKKGDYVVFLSENQSVAHIDFGYEEFSNINIYHRMYSSWISKNYPIIGKFITKYNGLYIIETINPRLNSNNNNILAVSTNIKLYTLEESIKVINDFYDLRYKNLMDDITANIVENYVILKNNQLIKDKIENQLKTYVKKHSSEEESYNKVVTQMTKGLNRINSKLSKNIEKNDEYKLKLDSIYKECLFLKWGFTNFINEIIKNNLTK